MNPFESACAMRAIMLHHENDIEDVERLCDDVCQTTRVRCTFQVKSQDVLSD